MDFYSLISDFFQRHLETTSLAVDALAEATGAAVEQAAEAILNERKLFSIGLGADCAGATALASLLHCGVLRERPSLPVSNWQSTTLNPLRRALTGPANRFRRWANWGTWHLFLPPHWASLKFSGWPSRWNSGKWQRSGWAIGGRG